MTTPKNQADGRPAQWPGPAPAGPGQSAQICLSGVRVPGDSPLLLFQGLRVPSGVWRRIDRTFW